MAPAGAEPVPVDDLYERIADDVGFLYGPAFQGLRAAWRRDGELFAEVELAEAEAAEAERFGVHPALLDAALHTGFAAGTVGAELPFSWQGVRLHGPGAQALRVRVAASDGGMSIDATDRGGRPVLSVAMLATRPVERARLGRRGRDGLLRLGWVAADAGAGGGVGPVSVVGPAGGVAAGLAAAGLEAGAVERLGDACEGGETPSVVLVDIGGGGQDSPLAAAREAVVETLALLSEFLADERFDGARLAVVTTAAVAVADGERPDPVGAAVRGLVRSARSEHPGRFGLVDVDGSEASWAPLAAALDGLEEESEVALRAGEAFVPRLARAASAPAVGGAALDPAGTVLVTGGVSGIGALVARHLAAEHGVRRLLLTSRRGPDAAGAAELVAELAELGCEARVEACDVSDRGQVEALLRSVEAEWPLTGVFHSAGVLDDGAIESLTAERVLRVLAPKVDAAWHLHELTAGLDLAQFVLFSSVAATFGGPGQGNYAAANAFMDALAACRHADGLPAASIAWGLWEQASEMTGDLDDADAARIARMGILPIEPAHGLELFDAARALDAPNAVALPLDLAALRPLAREGQLPEVLRGLVSTPARRTAVVADALARRLAEVGEAEREAVLLDLVRDQAASVLGHSSAGAIGEQAAFKDLGFDSLTAVELRNRLAR